MKTQNCKPHQEFGNGPGTGKKGEEGLKKEQGSFDPKYKGDGTDPLRIWKSSAQIRADRRKLMLDFRIDNSWKIKNIISCCSKLKGTINAGGLKMTEAKRWFGVRRVTRTTHRGGGLKSKAGGDIVR